MARLRNGNYDLDTVDRRLLEALVANARTSNSELARLVGLSAPSVADRIRRLEDAGVIEGYSATVNPEALGLPIAAWLRIRPVPGRMHQVAELIRGLPDVVACDRITGEDCFLARAQVASVAALERLIDRIVPYATTNTSIIQSSPVAQRLPPPAAQ